MVSQKCAAAACARGLSSGEPVHLIATGSGSADGWSGQWHCHLALGSGCGCHDSGWHCFGCRGAEDDAGLGGSVSSLDSCALSGPPHPAPQLQPAWATTAESAPCLGGTAAAGIACKPAASSFPSSGAVQDLLAGSLVLSLQLHELRTHHKDGTVLSNTGAACWPACEAARHMPPASVRRRQLGSGQRHPRLPDPGAGCAHARGAAAAAGRHDAAGGCAGAVLVGSRGDRHLAAARPAA